MNVGCFIPTLEQLWQEFDEAEIDKLRLEKMNLCHEMIKLADSDKKEKIVLELNLIWLFHGLHHIFQNVRDVDNNALSSQIELFVRGCNNKALTYYERRKDETRSLLNRSRYDLACWWLSQKKDVALLEDAISSAIRCIINNLGKREPIDTIDLLALAFNIARIFNIKKYNIQINEVAIKVFFGFVNTEHARWMIEPIEIFTSLNKKYDSKLVNEMITLLHREAHRFRRKNNSHLERSLLEASVELCDLLELDFEERQELKKIIQLMIANSHERDADASNNPDDALAAVQFYREAQLQYEKAGLHTKAKELNEKIREASGKIQYKVLEYRFTLPKLDLNGRNGLEYVASFCEYRDNIPSKSWAEGFTKELLGKYPISSLARNITFNEKNPLSYGNDEQETLRLRIKQQVTNVIRLAERRLSMAMKKLEDERKVSESDFITVLSNTGLYDADQLAVIRSGIHNHFAGDYVASIHILMPQIEGTLRILLRNRGVSTLKTKGEIIMDNELGGLLAKQEVQDILGEDFVNYMKAKYSDPDGINLRNNVSHALSPLSEFNYETSLMVIHTICKIAELSFDNKN